MVAAVCGYEEIVDVLVAHGADIEAKDKVRQNSQYTQTALVYNYYSGEKNTLTHEYLAAHPHPHETCRCIHTKRYMYA